MIKPLAVWLILIPVSCSAQKLVQKMEDAKKLEINQEQFIGKPFSFLLDQIVPKIGFVFGSPDKQSYYSGGPGIMFHFVDKNAYREMIRQKKQPVGVLVRLIPDSTRSRKPLPIGGRDWTKGDAKEYGDMIVRRISVTGND